MDRSTVYVKCPKCGHSVALCYHRTQFESYQYHKHNGEWCPMSGKSTNITNQDKGEIK